MLEYFFNRLAELSRMRQGTLAYEIDEIAEELDRAGYTRETARRYLSLIGGFSRHAAENGCTRPERVDRAAFERFLAEAPRSAHTRTVARSALGHVRRHLARKHGDEPAAPAPKDPKEHFLVTYDAHLRDVRGLCGKSREELLRVARRVIAWHCGERPGQGLETFDGRDVLACAAHLMNRCRADSTRSAALSALRSLLRHLVWRGVLDQDLSHLVPRVPSWRMARIPSHLPWDAVRRAIEVIDAGELSGLRDRAILLLFATLGLRNGELRRLELGDIRWRVGELRLRRTKSGRERVLPLLGEPGRALADYMLRGRPRTAAREVFVTVRPPFRALQCASVVSKIVGRRFAKCGIRPQIVGAHLIRHSLATRMVRCGRPIKEVADLLGHRRIDTTAVYVKVAVPQLAEVALPFPGGRR